MEGDVRDVQSRAKILWSREEYQLSCDKSSHKVGEGPV